MRYLVKARLKPEKGPDLLRAVESGRLGEGSVAGDEYLHNMKEARIDSEGIVQWVETCFCAVPLDEERPYWEEFFDLISVKDAHARRNCRHENGSEAWACCDCDCTRKLERHLSGLGKPFLLERLPKPVNGVSDPQEKEASADIPVTSEYPVPQP